MLKLASVIVAIVVGCCGGAAIAADQVAKATPVAPAAAPSAAVRVADCSAFYDDYRRRGFGWGVGPGSSIGFGAFEGALPRYKKNEFPNWYGSCVNWGHYSSSGSAPF